MIASERSASATYSSFAEILQEFINQTQTFRDPLCTPPSMSHPTPSPPVSFHFRIIRHKNRGVEHGLEIGVDCKGKEEKQADWRTLGTFIGDGQDSLTQQELIEMIPLYEMHAYQIAPEQTSRVRKLWLCEEPCVSDYVTDEDARKAHPYKRYGWQPVTISIEPNERGKHEKWKSKKKILDIEVNDVKRCVLWDPRSDNETNDHFISYFLRSGNPIFGQNFCPRVTFEFRGFTEALGLCTLPTNDTTSVLHTVVWVFRHYPNAIPKHHRIEAIKHTIRAKLKYQVRIAGVAVGDCRAGGSRTAMYRHFPVDFVFEHNGISPVTVMYEEIELVYYTNIEVLPMK